MHRTCQMIVSGILLAWVWAAGWGVALGQIDVGPYEKQTDAGPVRGMVAVVDLSHPDVSVHVTGPIDRAAATRPFAPGVDSRLIPTDRWAKDNRMTLAINANFFAWVNGSETEAAGADTLGLSVSDGVVVSPPREWRGQTDPAIVFLEDNTPRIIGPGQPPVDLARVRNGVAGIGGGERDDTPGTLLVQNGKNLGETARVSWNQRHPRTAVGIDATGKRLIVLVIDGRQPGWSIGMTLPELAEAMIGLGAVDAVNLDGGGSSSFVYLPPDGSAPVTNRPSDRSTPETPGVFRAVSNHLGFRVTPRPAEASPPREQGN